MIGDEFVPNAIVFRGSDGAQVEITITPHLEIVIRGADDAEKGRLTGVHGSIEFIGDVDESAVIFAEAVYKILSMS